MHYVSYYGIRPFSQDDLNMGCQVSLGTSQIKAPK